MRALDAVAMRSTTGKGEVPAPFNGDMLEYLDGEIFAMAGGTPEHGIAAAKLIQLLGARLPAPCQVMTSDVKVRVQATGLSTFPDLSVVCGPLERAAEDQNAVVNPTLLVEVLSPSTEEYDRGEKLRHYQQLSSLQAVLLVALETRRVTLVRRTPTGWAATDHADSVEVPGVGLLDVRSLWS
jgi:Uma2 family endonuclease